MKYTPVMSLWCSINTQSLVHDKSSSTSINVKLLSNKKDCYRNQAICHNDNDLVAIRIRNKVTLTLNKPAYVGMCIWDLNKVLMYKLHHDYIKNKYNNNSRLLFTNIDSLTYEIKTENVYEDFSKDKEMFDFSN